MSTEGPDHLAYQKYLKTIKGKRVVFVGPARNIEGKGLGKWIDSFDLVAKTTGTPWINNKSYFKDYGSRSDLYFVNAQFARLMNPQVVRFRAAKIKHIRTKVYDPRWLKLGFQGIFISSLRESMMDFYPEHKMATLGTIAIHDILKANPKELHITGMDFYLSREYPADTVMSRDYDYSKQYVHGYQVPEFYNQIPNVILRKNNWDGHTHRQDGEYILKLFKAGKIEMKSYIYEALIKSIKKFTKLEKDRAF